MKRRNEILGQVLGMTVLTVGLLSTVSCEEVDKICPGLACADDGVKEGNASITGYSSIDAFFNSVINFKSVAAGVNADIQAELDGIQGAFGISNADLGKANGKLGAAIKTKIEGTFKQKLVVKAQPAKCEINASIAADVTADCQAKAKCDVDPGKASFECMGSCTVDASVEGKCEGSASVVCEVSAPDFQCMGSCEGTCTANLTAAASCSGSCTGTCSAMCEGTCEGTCMGDMDSGPGCKGTCMGTCTGSCSGMCQGKCELTGMAALDCKASCNGKCTYKPGMASCDARAKVSCELDAKASAECTGKCEGEFEPPKADCEASASCEASAKAEAKFQAKCTPPSIDVRWVSTGTVDASVKAQFDFAMAELKVRLPRLSAAAKKAELVFDAAAELTSDGADAISGGIDALADSDVEASVKFRLATCAPGQLDASGKAIAKASGEVQSKLTAASEVMGAVGM